MTPSKLWYAQKLAQLLNDGTTAEDLVDKFTIRRLCYEIEKLEDETETETETEKKSEKEKEKDEEVVKSEKVKSFWARLSLETSSDEDEVDLEKKES